MSVAGTNVEWVGTIGAGPLLGVKRKQWQRSSNPCTMAAPLPRDKKIMCTQDCSHRFDLTLLQTPNPLPFA